MLQLIYACMASFSIWNYNIQRLIKDYTSDQTAYFMYV
jgi:hypothetical protein